ncbi:hypothetical protein D3C86_1644640 [compost metagenome]
MRQHHAEVGTGQPEGGEQEVDPDRRDHRRDDHRRQQHRHQQRLHAEIGKVEAQRRQRAEHRCQAHAGDSDHQAVFECKQPLRRGEHLLIPAQ